MATREIPNSDWDQFFRDFTRSHQGWIVSIDVFSQALGAQKAATDLVFGGFVVERERDGRLVVQVMLGESTQPHLMHRIASPTHIRWDGESDGETVQIEAEDDTTVLISSHRSALPARVAYSVLQETR